MLINRKNKNAPGNELALASFNPRRSKRSRRKLNRWGIIGGNLALLLVIAVFIGVNRSASHTVRSSTINSVVATAGSSPSPLDQLSSSQIALHAAQMTKLPEFTAIKNQADSESALASGAAVDSIATKPQIVSTAQKSKHDIVTYKAKPGDTISSIAVKFNLSANSVRWSNGLSGEAIAAGKDLLIPPGNGVVYKVKSGDTISSIISTYQANQDAFITVNDAESGSLKPGELVWIPNGTQPLPRLRFSTAGSGGYAWGYSAVYGTNGYDYGYCTWWAALRRTQIGRPIPSNLGNACTWKSRASMAGLGVGRAPQVGAVIWTPSGCWGHVGFVEKINPDGSVWVSDMNSRGYRTMDVNSGGAGGWGRVSYRLLTPSAASGFWYIY